MMTGEAGAAHEMHVARCVLVAAGKRTGRGQFMGELSKAKTQKILFQCLLCAGGGDLHTKFWCRSRPGDLFKERWWEADTDPAPAPTTTTAAAGGSGAAAGGGAGDGGGAGVGGAGGGIRAPGLGGLAGAPGLGGSLARIPGLGDIVSKLAKIEPNTAGEWLVKETFFIFFLFFFSHVGIVCNTTGIVCSRS